MITILAVGKIKEKYLTDGINEYLKRLSIYEQIKIVELKETTNLPIQENIKKEGELILSKINLISWWGKVKLEKDKPKFFLLITSVDKPFEPPIINTILVVP